MLEAFSGTEGPRLLIDNNQGTASFESGADLSGGSSLSFTGDISKFSTNTFTSEAI